MAWVIREEELSADKVLKILDSVDLERVSNRIKDLELIKPNGAEAIAEIVESLSK